MKKSQAAKRRERQRKQANKAMNITIMIPALNPDQKLTNYVKQLANEDFCEIVVINDGSSDKYDPIFDEIAVMEKCTVLRHKVNRGKGRALKTGMDYVLKNHPDCVGIVTGDADGQHRLKDTIRVAKELLRDDNRLILGSRNFNSPDIPARSSFGNKVTSGVFAVMFGQKLMDTQTGLRGIPLKMFEYEMNMLIECRKHKIEIYEIPIDTVYIDENSSSHFNPIIDSVKIYLLIFRSFFSFIFTSIGCTLLDLAIFTVLARFVISGDFRYRILVATAVARVISATVNFIVNKNVVFHKKGHIASSATKYFCLAVVQMLISAKSVEFLVGLLGWHETIVKAIVDTILFIFNYFIQKKFVFKK